MTDLLDVQDRLILLCPLITLPSPLLTPKAVRSEADCSFAADDLPVYVITRGPGRESNLSTDTYQAQRDYLLKLYVVEICNPAALDENETEAALAASCVQPTLDFFHARRGLELDDAGIVAAQNITQDIPNPRRFTRNSRVYSGALFRMQVFTRYFSE